LILCLTSTRHVPSIRDTPQRRTARPNASEDLTPMNKHRTVLLATSLLAQALAAQLASAQQAAPTADAADQYKTLDNIVVTATKRAQTAQTVPISMTAVSGAELERRGVTSLSDLARIAPSLSVTSSGPGSNNLVIRGISSSAGSAATVGYYLDDVPISASSNAALLSTRGVIDPALFDIERVEVLRGPQGTIYGSSSMGGTIKYVSVQPDTEFSEGKVKVDLSNTHTGGNNANISGSFNLPIKKDVMGLRVSAYSRYDDGYIDRYSIDPDNYLAADPNGTKKNNVNTYQTSGIRAALLIKPDQSLSITPSIIYQRVKLGSPFTYDKGPASLDDPYQVRSVDERNVQKSMIANLSVVKHFASFDMTSSTSYFTRDFDIRDDSSKVINYFFGLPAVYPTTMYGSYKNKEFTQELRGTSQLDVPLQFTGGVFFHHVRAPLSSSIPYPDGFNAAFNTPFPGYDTIYAGERYATMKEYAVFGEVSYDFTDKLKGSIGIRGFKVDQTFDQSGDGLLNGGPSHVYNTSSDRGATPKYTLQYQATPDSMLYATVSKGYRAGGPNNPAPASLCGVEVGGLGLSETQLSKYGPDYLWNYEAGFKTAWLDRRLQVNGSLYRMDWKDVQQQIVLDCGYNITANFGSAVSQGGELEINYLPSQSLSLTLGAGYNDATLKTDVPGTSAKDGDRLTNVPRFSGSASAEYRMPVNDTYEGFVRGDLSYVGDSTFLYDRTSPFYRRAGFATTNLRAGVRGGNGIDLSLYVTNVFDKRGETDLPVAISADLPTTRRVAINQPRTIGVTLEYSF
jgi:iron complex outermembrane receptor protein